MSHERVIAVMRARGARAEREAATAQVLFEHYPSADRHICSCGKEWHPLHQAKELERAGLLKGSE